MLKYRFVNYYYYVYTNNLQKMYCKQKGESNKKNETYKYIRIEK